MNKRQKGRMAMKVDNQRNFPVPWKPRKWSSSADIGRLPSVATSILQGPNKTQYGSIIGRVPRTFAIVENGIRGFQSRHKGLKPIGSHAIDEAERLERQRRVSPSRSKRLASGDPSSPEQATLTGTPYPSARQKRSERALYSQPRSLFTPERRSILAQGPLGIVKRVMGELGM